MRYLALPRARALARKRACERLMSCALAHNADALCRLHASSELIEEEDPEEFGEDVGDGMIEDEDWTELVAGLETIAVCAGAVSWSGEEDGSIRKKSSQKTF